MCQSQREWVATLDGFVNAQIRAPGFRLSAQARLRQRLICQEGTTLFQIDPRTFQAALEQAKGNVEQAKGNVGRAEGDLQIALAKFGKTQLDVARYTPLAKESAISRQELDDAVQADLGAKAQVEASKANIEAAKATIVAASTGRGYCPVESRLHHYCFAGRRCGSYLDRPGWRPCRTAERRADHGLHC